MACDVKEKNRFPGSFAEKRKRVIKINSQGGYFLLLEK